jgi:hypothetical protein
MKKLTIAELNQKFTEADQADQSIFAEQRSNVLLITGEHYSNKGHRFFNSIRDQKELSKEQKLRLTKNHIQRIVKTYVNNILTYAPGVTCLPKNETELQDIKAAELHNAVLDDIKDRHRMVKKVRQWAEDFVGIGEVAVKIFWDPMAGEFKGYQQAQDALTGALEFDPETGTPVPQKSPDETEQTPIFGGDFVYERIYGFNLFRPKEAKDMDQAEWIGIRKMCDLEELKLRVGDDEDKLKMLQESKDETYVVFDGAQGGYGESKGQVMLREFYFRPGPKYPKGYFYITTPHGILWEGELPFGVFPIAFTTFEDIPTTPRGRSIVKTCRPYQAEINRAASKIAEHQITLGDDKLLYQAGAKLTNGSVLPGVRGIQVSGANPTILPGRDGSQYLNYLQSQIREMYQAAMLEEDMMEKNEGQVDPYSMLFKSMRQKKRFSVPAQKFEQFLVDVFTITLDLARHYLPEDAVIYAAGRREQVNIPEFKNASRLCYQIKVEPQTEDMDSQMGKQLMLNHILQYAGPQLAQSKPEMLGMVISEMPMANVKAITSDLTVDYENVKNDILALDRGDYPVPNPTDNHAYYVKRLTNRMKQADFRFLPQPVKLNYLRKLEAHEKLEAEQLQKLKAMQSELIPTGGAMIACDMYVNDSQDPTKAPKRVRVPYQALDWLLKIMEKQGMSLQKLEAMQQSAQVQIAGMVGSSSQPQAVPGAQGRAPVQPQPAPANAMAGQRPGAGMPGGVANGNASNQPINAQFRHVGGTGTPVQPVPVRR